MQRGKATVVAQIGIGPLLQEKDRECPVAARGGDHQRGLAVGAAAVVHIHAGLQQETPRLDVSLLRGEQQRSEATLRTGARIGAVVDEQPDDVGRSVGGRPHERRLTAVGFSCVHVRAMVEQQTRGVAVPVVDGGHQWRLTRPERRVRIRVCVQEQPDQGKIAARAGHRERGAAVFIRRVDLRPRSQDPT